MCKHEFQKYCENSRGQSIESLRTLERCRMENVAGVRAVDNMSGTIQ